MRITTLFTIPLILALPLGTAIGATDISGPAIIPPVVVVATITGVVDSVDTVSGILRIKDKNDNIQTFDISGVMIKGRYDDRTDISSIRESDSVTIQIGSDQKIVQVRVNPWIQ